MRSITLFIGLLVYSITSYAQITLTQAVVPGVGDIVVAASDTTASDLNIGAGGPNQSWNFLTLEAHQVSTTNYLLPDQAPLAAAFPDANLCALADGAYNFLEVSESAYVGHGIAVDLTGNKNYAPIRITPPQALMVFPATYGTTFPSNFSIDLTIDGSALGVDSLRIKQSASQTSSIDSYGVVVMPNGVYDALRSHIVTNSVDSIWALFFGEWLLVDAQINEFESYQWLAAESKGILVSVDVDPNGVPTTATFFVSYTPAVQAPEAAFTFEPAGSGEFLFTDASSNNPTEWLWDFGDNTTSAEQNPGHTYTASDIYEVCLTASNAGGASTVCQTISVVIVSAEEPGSNVAAKVFPNPVQDVLRFQVNFPLKGGEYASLFDAFGKMIKQTPLLAATDMPVSNLPEGTYFYQLVDSEGRMMQSGKVIIE